jgi:hypothetical protein
LPVYRILHAETSRVRQPARPSLIQAAANSNLVGALCATGVS